VSNFLLIYQFASLCITKTNVSAVPRTEGPKCVLVTSDAALWRVIVACVGTRKTWQTDGRTDSISMLYAYRYRHGQRNNEMLWNAQVANEMLKLMPSNGDTKIVEKLLTW